MIALVLLAGLSGALSLRAVIQLERMMSGIVTRSMESTQGALELENALLEQQGLIARAIASGATASLQELAWRSRRWQQVFDAVSRKADQPEERRVLAKLTASYAGMQQARQQAADRLQAGDVDGARRLLVERIDPGARDAHALCEQFVLLQRVQVSRALDEAQRHVVGTTILVIAGFLLTLGFGGALLVVLLRRIFRPLREVASEASRIAPNGNGNGNGSGSIDDFRELSASLRALARNAEDARASLATSQGLLQQAEATGRLAACVAHEVRSPLQTMSIALHSFQRQIGANPQLLERCEMFREEIDRLERIVRSFLEFAKPPRLEMGGVVIDEVIGRSLEMYGEQLDRAGVRVVFESEHEVPRVKGDPAQLRQVFQNLIRNSIEAMPAGGTIQVQRSVEVDASRPWLAVQIRDAGPGIPESVRARLFEPFVTSREEGTGLGLAIASSIVSRHGGRLCLESTGDAGTTFTLTLPVLTD